MFSLQGAGKNDSSRFGERSMKNGLSVVVAVTFALVTAMADAETTRGGGLGRAAVTPSLKVVGPVEAYDAQHGVARVLGQTVALPAAVELAVGDTATVVGTSAADGTIVASSIRSQGLYVAGSSPIFLTGHIQRVNAAVGTAI